jgi:uncharacterized RDD family membrane protein YckC
MRDELETTLEVRTPEQVVISLPLGGVGSRMLAYGWDLLIRMGLSLLIAIPAVFVTVNWPGMGPMAAVGALVGWFLLHFGYYVYHEVMHSGQTPGKRRVGLRTIKANGTPVDLTSSLLRNFLRVVDWMPGLYGLGVVSMFLTSSEQRLGDLTAGTVVVSESEEQEKAPTPVDREEYERLRSEMEILHPERIRPGLEAGEAEALRRLLGRVESLEPQRFDELTGELAERIKAHLEDPEEELRPYLDSEAGREAALRFVLFRHEEVRGE